jgi:hypothetical protein
MTHDPKLARAMAIVEAAVQTMAAEGISPLQRAIGLAWHMNTQIDIAMPTPETALMFKERLIA